MKVRKRKLLSFICVTVMLFITLFLNLSEAYSVENETDETINKNYQAIKEDKNERNLLEEEVKSLDNEYEVRTVNSKNDYTVINSQTLLESNSLDTLSLNYTSFPNVTVSGTETYTIADVKSQNSVMVRRVVFPNAVNGKTLDSVITVKFSNCGKLNGKVIDMKLIYSDIVTRGGSSELGNIPFLYWSAYGDTMATKNEWWYHNIEHVTVNAYFYYSGSSTPITLNTAYLSIFSEGIGEGSSSSTSSNQYIYEQTDMIYETSILSPNVQRTYQNVFLGATDGSTDSGILNCVSFQYQNKNNIEIELYSFNDTADVGYHLQYTSLTATIPNNPKKVVDKTSVNTGDHITYTISQDISKAVDNDFYYSSFVFKDILNSNLTYNALTVYDENNKNVTSTAGTINYNSSINTLEYTFFSSYLKNMHYRGQTYKFVINAIVNHDVTSGKITNFSSTIINNKYTLSSNTVTTKVHYKVIANYIDEEGNKLAESETITGYEGDFYKAEQKNIYAYELIEVPKNSTGTMEEEIITVTYVYRLKETGVIVKYVNEDGSNLLDNLMIKGKVLDEYKTEEKKIYGYKLIGIPENAIGEMKEDVITVTYTYKLKDTSVIAKYVDEKGNEIAEAKMIEGKVFDKYRTEEKKIYGYELIEMPENAIGEMKEDAITVNYTYKLKDTSVITKYVDEKGNEIGEAQTIGGKVFDKYRTEEKKIYGYELTEIPENAIGEMKENVITITYTYKLKDTNVIAKYIDENGNEIADEQIVEGKVFDQYKVEAKEIYGYELIEVPENSTGAMAEDTITIIYKYRKLEFNISVSKHLSAILLNGESKDVCEKLEIDRKIVVDSFKLTYFITVSNNGKLEGATTLYDYIPNGYIAFKEDNPCWTIKDNIAYIDISNLSVGEVQTYIIVLTASSREVTGIVTNTAICENSHCACRI